MRNIPITACAFALTLSFVVLGACASIIETRPKAKNTITLDGDWRVPARIEQIQTVDCPAGKIVIHMQKGADGNLWFKAMDNIGKRIDSADIQAINDKIRQHGEWIYNWGYKCAIGDRGDTNSFAFRYIRQNSQNASANNLSSGRIYLEGTKAYTDYPD